MVKKQEKGITLIEAVETLSHIADLDWDQDIGIAEPHERVIQGKKVAYRSIHWFQEQDADTSLKIVREIFRVILSYLQDFYKYEYRHVENQDALEHVKTVMVLVGEAAKKLDKYAHFFKEGSKRVTEIKEYQKLQEFYFSKIARKIDEGVLGKWLLGLTKGLIDKKRKVNFKGKKTTKTKHIFVDLEAVKKDTEYELFFIRKEDGGRFYSPRLIRNIKLVSDFGSYFGEAKADDPLSSLPFWKDLYFHETAKQILQEVGEITERFFHVTAKHRKRELTAELNEALMALMFAANSKHLLKNSPRKTCGQYFADFLFFLRQALQCSYYHKLITYPPKRSNKVAVCLFRTCHSFCDALISSCRGYQEIGDQIKGVIREAVSKRSSEHQKKISESCAIWNCLASDYAAMMKLMKHHPNGPLIKILEELEQGIHHTFDPLIQDNLPNQLYSLYFHESKVFHLKLPSPTRQEMIQEAHLSEEFLGFLRSYKKKGWTHLLINFQDRTSWKEHFRSRALEELQENSEFSKSIVVVTLTKDTEFYQQLAPYHDENHANVFIKNFKQHLQDQNAGFYFPDVIRKKLFPNFVNRTLKEIHKIFFSEKNVLTREQRMDFIEIFYLFLELKLLDIVQPKSFSLTCKDGIDVGGAASAGLYIFLKLVQNLEWEEKDQSLVNMMLYTSPILIRERIMHPERFNRLIGYLRVIESAKEELQGENFSLIAHEAFGDLFQTDILKSLLLPIKG